MGGVEVKAGNIENMTFIDIRFYPVGDSLGAAIHPDDAQIAECIAVGVGGDDGVVYRVHADSADILGINAAFCNEVVNDAC